MYDEPEHFPIGVTVDGHGPVEPGNDAPGYDRFHHWECWCGQAGCTEHVSVLVENALRLAEETTKSTDPLVQLAWLIGGIDAWYKTDGAVGNSIADVQRGVLSRFAFALSHNSRTDRTPE